MSIARLPSRITAVTVYTTGAIVTREAELPAGAAGQVALAGLPLCLDDGSLRVRVVGAAATVSDVAVALDVPAADPALAPPEDAELRAARRAESEAEAVHEALAARIALLEGTQLKPRPEAQRGSPPAPIPVQARAALLDTVASELERLAGERLAAAEAQRVAAERRATIEARIAAATSARQARPDELRKSAVATLRWDGQPAAGGRLVFEYRVPGARWLPCYVVRFVPGQDRAEVQLRAAIRQRSGEDWNGVRLNVSSADALAWCPLPVLPSTRIGRRQSAPATGWRAPPQGAEALYADYDQAKAAREAVRDVPRPSPMAGAAAGAAPCQEEDSEVCAPVGGVAMRDEAPKLEKKRAGPPVPAPMAAMSAAAPEATARRSVRRAVPAKASNMKMDESEASYGAPSEPEPPRDDDPSAWLAYGAMRLAGPDEHGRGRLRPQPPQAAYLALLAEARITVSFSVLGILRQADARAADTTGDPPGTCWCSPDPAFASTWTAELPASVAADGAWRIVPVRSAQVAVEAAFVCVPRESRDVFRTAVLANPFPTPMPGGPADCYLGDRFLLTVPLAGVDTGGSVSLGLGVEQGVRVARNVEYGERSAGMFGGSTRAEHRVRVALANKLQRPVRIEVRERLPVADAEGCAVETQRVEPAWQEWHPPDRDLPGGHRWMVDLASGAERELALDYAITFSAKQELVGGNRREA